jgi:predicted lipid-binding transport protein (Tim44 family)
MRIQDFPHHPTSSLCNRRPTPPPVNQPPQDRWEASPLLDAGERLHLERALLGMGLGLVGGLAVGARLGGLSGAALGGLCGLAAVSMFLQRND